MNYMFVMACREKNLILNKNSILFTKCFDHHVHMMYTFENLKLYVMNIYIDIESLWIQC